ncbi:MAG: hypothetical protein RLZZ324_1157 [Candidatus Parcubacteria bacterium]|jgi:hypothetical protein
MPEPTMNFSNVNKVCDPDVFGQVTLFGAGSVGGYVAHGLAKLGVTDLTAYDDDVVESGNIPMSIYGQRDVGSLKVSALAEIVAYSAGTLIRAVPERFGGNAPLHGCIVCCVDTMAARRMIWECVRREDSNVELLVDTRTSKELIWVFAIDPKDPDDRALYEHHLRYKDGETAHAMCGEHGIDYASKVAAARACANLKEWKTRGIKKAYHSELTGSIELIP